MARNPFYVQPASPDVTPIAMGLQSFLQQRGAQKERDEARAAMLEAVQSGDPSKMAEFATQYPEYQQAAKTAFGFTNEASEEVARETYRRVLSDPENAGQYLAEGILRVNEMQGVPRIMMGDLEMWQQNPEAAIRAIRTGYASIDPKGYSALFGGDAELQVGAQQILEDGTIIQSTNRGPVVYDPTGKKVTGQAAADAVKVAQAERVSNQRKAAGLSLIHIWLPTTPYV